MRDHESTRVARAALRIKRGYWANLVARRLRRPAIGQRLFRVLTAMRGEPFLYPAAVAALIRDYLDRASRGEATPTDPLTARELEIVKLVAEGHPSDEIAETLVIAKKTVEHHRSHILEKLGMRDRVELTRYAIRRGLVEP